MSEEQAKNSKDENNNSTEMEVLPNKIDIQQLKNENLETTTIIPTTISYHSTLLPDAIFLTTSNGQLITTSTLNHVPVSLAEIALKNLTNEAPSAPSATKEKNEKKMKSKAMEEKGAPAKPSAKKKSAANTTTSKSTTKKKENTLLTTTNFPFLTATGGLATALTPIGFSSQNNFTSGFAPITTFSLQNPLLTPSLTIPIYNSLVAVAGGTNKDIIVPAINKESDTPTVTKKQTKSKSNNNNNNAQNNGNMTTSRGRKRTAQSRLPAKLKEPAAVARRNARERRRVKMVNDGFLRLRRHVPTDPKNKKLSKVKTLRLAIEYIHHLQQLLQTDSNTKNTTAAAQLVNTFAQVTTYEDLDVATGAWLHSDSLGRVTRDMDEDIFQSIDPERLRTNYSEYATR